MSEPKISKEEFCQRFKARMCVDWVDSRHSYDILRRTSPLWSVVEKEQ